MARILIIDDEPAVRGILKFQLEKAGHQITQAENGEEGLAAALSLVPDLIFLDVMIPKLDGWQVCRGIKNDPRTRHIPVVMLTGSQQKFQELRAWESGVDEYLTKPWEPKALREVTTKLLAPRRDAAR